jgi:hypothetical protein
VSGAYEGKQIVGMDLHRRRSVLVRMTETGEHLETVRWPTTCAPPSSSRRSPRPCSPADPRAG